MPTVKQLKSTKLRKTSAKFIRNAPRLPNANTLRAIKADPKIKRDKEAIQIIREMEMHRKQYINAAKKLKKIVA